MKKCENCQERQATVHMTDVSGSTVQNELHLCGECAEKKGLEYNVELQLSDLIPEDMNMQEIQELQDKEEELSSLQCPECGLTFEEFRKNRRLGCPNDYEIFSVGLDPLLEQIHDQLKHKGKVPETIDETLKINHEIEQLQEKLDELVEEEAFEEAADVRDKIHALKERREEISTNSDEPESDEEHLQ